MEAPGDYPEDWDLDWPNEEDEELDWLDIDNYDCIDD